MTGVAIPQQPQLTRAFGAVVLLTAMIVAGVALANRGIGTGSTTAQRSSVSAEDSYRAHVASERALSAGVNHEYFNLQASERALAASRISGDASYMAHTSTERAFVARQLAADEAYRAQVASERALVGSQSSAGVIRLGDDESYFGLIAAERALAAEQSTQGFTWQGASAPVVLLPEPIDRDPSDGPLPLTVGPTAR